MQDLQDTINLLIFAGMKKEKKARVPHPEREVFSKNLKLFRTRMGLTQEKFGELIGVSRAVQQTYESGKNEVSYKTMQRIHSVTGASLHRLMYQDISSLSDEQVDAIASGYDNKQWDATLEHVKQ